MKEYTVIYFPNGLYFTNRNRLEKILNGNELVWNEMKVVKLSPEDVLGVYIVFGYRDSIAGDVNLKRRSGSSEIWQKGSDCFVKGVFFEKRSEDEQLPVLMIIKECEGSKFYSDFIKYCIGIGCTLSKVAEDRGKFKEVFKKRTLDDNLVKRFINSENTKDTMKEIFLNRISQFNSIYKFDNGFIKEWLAMIEKHGKYYDKELYEKTKTDESEKT